MHEKSDSLTSVVILLLIFILIHFLLTFFLEMFSFHLDQNCLLGQQVTLAHSLV